jgi:3-hydroxyisobutyrate dehydrogenase-like beta-hydroxyacid dehydrogenase
MRVGIVGLGKMGAGIGARILLANFSLAVWNRSPAPLKPLVDASATSTPTARHLAATSDVVLTCLTGDEAILEVMQGPDGLLAGLKPDAIHLCLMTISPQCADELERMHEVHGSRFVSGPVSGRPDAAAAGSLLTYLAGPADAIATVKPLCSAYANNVVVVGERPRAANCLKLSINFTLCSIMEVFGEAYTFAEKCGVNPDLLNDWYQMSFAHPAIKTYANKIRGRDFDTAIGYTMTGGLKDVRLMLSTAQEVGMNLEMASLVEAKTLAAIEAGMSDSDWTGFTEITRQLATGVAVGATKKRKR